MFLLLCVPVSITLFLPVAGNGINTGCVCTLIVYLYSSYIYIYSATCPRALHRNASGHEPSTAWIIHRRTLRCASPHWGTTASGGATGGPSVYLVYLLAWKRSKSTPSVGAGGWGCDESRVTPGVNAVSVCCCLTAASVQNPVQLSRC